MKQRADFVAAFGTIVLPDLRRQCRFQGSQVALDLLSMGEAFDIVWADARHRGALMLPPTQMEDLESLILVSILKAAEEFLPEVLEYRAMSDRVYRDILRTEAKWHEIWGQTQ